MVAQVYAESREFHFSTLKIVVFSRAIANTIPVMMGDPLGAM
jgi:hypothetical protein